ncbi:MAG: hemerythrin domain-containing protein [Candidatus Zixiibacteriota bacterium]
MAGIPIEIDFLVGIPEIDDAHAIIKAAAEDFQDLLASTTPQKEVIAAFEHLKQLIIGHFALEEKIFQVLERADDDGRAHVVRHRRNHQLISDSFTYAFDRIAATGTGSDLPNIIGLVPERYLKEMAAVDREMAELLARQRGATP